MIDHIISILAGLIAVIFIFAPHEFAHAYVAYKCGDPTAKMQGRLTLNPMKHIDPAGFLLCAVTGFGWAKPVPIYPPNFRHYRKGLFLTAIAGVVTNYIIAFIAYPLANVVYRYLYMEFFTFFVNNQWLSYLVELLYTSLGLIFVYSLSVFVFNLLPLYPLDGFRVVEAFTREINPVRRFLRVYGMWILLILVLESFLCDVLIRYTTLPYVGYFDILGWVGWFAQNIIGWPITAFWGLIF